MGGRRNSSTSGGKEDDDSGQPFFQRAETTGCEKRRESVLASSIQPRAQRRRSTLNFNDWVVRNAEEREAQKRADSKKIEEKEVARAEASDTMGCNFKNVITNLSKIREVFDHYDTDHSGTIEPPEFPFLLAKCTRTPRYALNMKEVWRQWAEIDEDGSDTINFDEFRGWYIKRFGMLHLSDDEVLYMSEMHVPQEEELLREVACDLEQHTMDVEKVFREFNKLDEDKSGYLDRAEFAKLIKMAVAPKGVMEVPAKIVDAFWRDCDRAKAGIVTFPAFAKWYFEFFSDSVTPMERYYQVLGKGFRGAA